MAFKPHFYDIQVLAPLSTLSTLKYIPFLFLKTLFPYPLTIAHSREIETNPKDSDIIQ